jgi:hypothetical protein
MTDSIEELKEGKYNISEYPLEDGNGVAAVECVPESIVNHKNRLKVIGLDTLQVRLQ